MVVSFIMLLMFAIDFVLTRPFNKCNVSQIENTQHYFGNNLTHSKKETNYRECTELKFHFLRICPNLTNMSHYVVLSVVIKRRRRSVFNEHLSKRSFYYARLLLLLLLLAGDVERNPGPVDSMEDKQKKNCISTVMDCSDKDKELKEKSSNSHVVDRLEQFAMSQRKHREKESIEQRESRLKVMQITQKKRIELETAEEHDKRLGILVANQHKRLEKETAEDRDKRLIKLVTNQQKRLEKETAEDRNKGLRTLVTNQQKRLEKETAEERDKRLKVLLTNREKRLEKETEEMRSKKLKVYQGYRKKQLDKETPEERTARLEMMAKYRKVKLEMATEEEEMKKENAFQRKRRWQEGESEEAKKERLVKERLQKKQAREKQKCAEQVGKNYEDEELKGKVRQQQERKRRWKEGESEEAKRARLEKDRLRKKQARERKQSKSMEEIGLSEQQQIAPLTKSEAQIVSNRDKFLRAICNGPSCACFACLKLCYKENAHLCSSEDANKLTSHVTGNSQFVTTEWFCNRCISALNRKKIPSTSRWNRMSTASVPKELQDLNSMEERLIARVAPFMKLVLLPRGGQRGITGQVINFPSPMTEVLNQLPRPATGSDIVYIKPPTASKESKSLYYRCRYTIVMNALQWLKENNSAYKNVKITEHCQENFVETENEEEAMEESGVVRSDFLMPDVPVTNYLQEGTFPVHQLEKITCAPLSIFNDQQLEVLAFPTLYPNGNNGFGTHRQFSITPLDYFQSRIMSKDSRWAKHPSYIFWACNIVEAIKLQSSISIALRLRNPTSGRKNKQKKTLTAGELRSTGVGENPDVRENCYSFMRDIRGTAAYWQSARIQLFAMLRTLGPPTFFITFSADDHHWKDLMVVLASCSGRNISNEQVDELSDEERRTLMTSNPVVTTRHFQHRFQSLVKEIIKGSGRPIGEVTDFFWRVEFQLRGSPHIHS